MGNRLNRFSTVTSKKKTKQNTVEYLINIIYSYTPA